MMKYIFLVCLIGAVYAEEQRDANQFLIDNIVQPFVDSVVTNTVNLVTDAVTSVVTGFFGLFGKRDASQFLIDNIVQPFVDTVVTNTVNLVTDAVTGVVTSFFGLFGKRGVFQRDFWQFVDDNIVQPFVDTVITNTVNLVTDAVTGLVLGIFGKRDIANLTEMIKPIVVNLTNAVVQSLSNFILTIKPLAEQVIFRLPGPAVHVGIVSALIQVDEDMRISTQNFINSIFQVLSGFLSNVQLSQVVSQINSAFSVLLNLSQFLQPIVSQFFALLNKPFVTQLVTSLLG